MKKTVILILILNLYVFSQEKIIAKIGNDVITQKEFEFKYETTFKLLPVYFTPDTSRYHFLYSLIAYKLWYLDAKEKGYKLSDINQYQLDYIKKNLLKDVLYKQEILNKIVITKKDRDEAYSKMLKDIECYSIASTDSILIFKFYQSFKKGFPFLSVYENDEFENQNQPIKITYGNLNDEKLEDLIYSLKQGEYSKPYKIDNLWAIYYVNKIYMSPFTIDIHLKEKADKILKQRKADALLEEYLKKISKNSQYSINNKLLLNFIENVYPNLFKKEDKNATYWTVKNKFFLDLIKKTSEDTLKIPFIKSKNLEISYKDFLIFMFNNEFKLYNLDKKYLYANIKYHTQELYKNEILYREALKKELDKNPEFIKEFRSWEEYYYGKFYTNDMLDTIKISNNEKVRYKEILNNLSFEALQISNKQLDVFSNILQELNDNNFIEIAEKYSLDKNIRIKISKDNNSEFLNFVKDAKANEIVGPFKHNDNYYLIKILEISENDTLARNYDFTSKLAAKRMGVLGTYTAKLAIKYGLQINESLVNSLELTNTNMMTYKLLGFGGRMLANPFIEQYIDWVKYWKEMQLNP